MNKTNDMSVIRAGEPSGLTVPQLEDLLVQSQEKLITCQDTIAQMAARIQQLEVSLQRDTEKLEQTVADHKRIEVAIEVGKRQWEATFDAVTDMIILTATQGKIIRCNRSTINYLHKTYQDLIGNYIDEAFFGKQEHDPQIFETRSAVVQFPSLPGWFYISNYPLLQDGVAYGTVYVIEDITERRQAEEALRVSQDELRKAFDDLETRVNQRTIELSEVNQNLKHEINQRETIQAILAKEKELLAITLLSIRDGAISVDKNGVILLYNKAAENITGYSQAEVLGKNVNEVLKLLDGKSDQTIVDSLSTLLKQEKPRHQTLLTKDGKKLLISSSCAPVNDSSGNLVGYVLTFDNITEQKRMEEQLALGQKLESIGQLAAGIAHEINTPMQYVGDNTHFMNDAFQGVAKLLEVYDELIRALESQADPSAILDELKRKKEELDIAYFVSEIPTAISQSLDGIERVRKIVLAMKAFSHPGNKEKHPSSINQGVETTMTISRNEWKYIADMELDLDPNLPLVYCEIDEINQVFLNMIINAVHAIQDVAAKGGAKHGKITIRTRQDDKFALISIQDTGCGIPPANMNRIFDPFFTTKEVGKGTGQGLSLAHNIIVNEHKGNILVDSEVGKGTTFTIRLPINDPDSGKTENPS